MQAFVKLYWQICRLKKGPEDVPWSLLLLFTAIASFAGLDIFYLSLFKLVVWRTALMLVILSGYTYLVLSLKSRIARLVQTLTALFACSALLYALALPSVLLHLSLPQTELTALQTGLALLATLYGAVILLWMFIVMSHIFARAVDAGFFSGILLTFGLYGVDLLITSLVMPMPMMANA